MFRAPFRILKKFDQSNKTRKPDQTKFSLLDMCVLHHIGIVTILTNCIYEWCH